eukprot:CAMPEP_0172532882 /NCGR_PEP_ID=MMETSP1067-20121228/5772_1 /TAXON_ID=265564 ORGANISM="Thalassiosira punctigera, Strain Tpunct2005C2" /NCGR_SAMPLE_ID=MMETSP1067 /ASSEMBLY_ACC=CAM_ASM_000444 /LENGTH=78 /DNA_ID=CAMNT_0013317443 /DNA_START=52 /DNA_END=285 /DNA_ORIENTATION=-
MRTSGTPRTLRRTRQAWYDEAGAPSRVQRGERATTWRRSGTRWARDKVADASVEKKVNATGWGRKSRLRGAKQGATKK